MKLTPVVLILAFACAQTSAAQTTPESAAVRAEHAAIGIADSRHAKQVHTTHPDAQWFPDAGFGLFLHWGLASVKAMNISWPMIPGRRLSTQRIEDPSERLRIVRESDYNLDGKPPAITPNEYWAMARDFKPQAYDPDKWLKAAREAGFTYAVLTAKHHEGFALWPSAYGELSTKTYMDGRDLVRPYVEACRKHGLKVGLYFSGPDWYFDREYMSFLYNGARTKNPELPSLGPDLKPRVSQPSEEEVRKHRIAYAALVSGQIEELLTRYGKIDLLWFDGRPSVSGAPIITLERIRELQPGIVVNPRLYGTGDFTTFERTLPESRPDVDWAELCNTWTTSWSYQDLPFRANGFILGQLALTRSWGFNYLLGVGPMASGELPDAVYRNMAEVAEWLKVNGQSIQGTRPLPAGETASGPAVAREGVRYLFALPAFDPAVKYPGNQMPEAQLPPADSVLTLKGVAKPRSVTLLATGAPLRFTYEDGTLSVTLTAATRTRLVDVVKVEID